MKNLLSPHVNQKEALITYVWYLYASEYQETIGDILSYEAIIEIITYITYLKGKSSLFFSLVDYLHPLNCKPCLEE